VQELSDPYSKISFTITFDGNNFLVYAQVALEGTLQGVRKLSDPHPYIKISFTITFDGNNFSSMLRLHYKELYRVCKNHPTPSLSP
jgi:hypothetical protein